MFRLFLRKKILAGDESAPPVRPPRRRNRRIFARYEMNHKHLTLMNEQDILLVREISAKGFSTEVSKRGFKRLICGDVYEARIRYSGEIFDLQAKVTWKQTRFVGFEIVKASRETLSFLKRLIKPIEIAQSLQPVDASFAKEVGTGKTWYHGDEDSDLYTWHNVDTSELRAWQLAVGEHYVEWSTTQGLTSGSLVQVEGKEVLLGANLQGLTHNRDSALDPQKRQFAFDIIMALQFSVRDQILETLDVPNGT